MNLQEEIMKVCLKIAKRGEGAMILIGECEYKVLVEQNVSSFNVMKNPKLLESLALMDGAVIINNRGDMKAYGAMIKVSKLSMIRNLGTRHNSAMAASMRKGNTIYVVSEEDNRVRVFRGGKMIMEIDSKTKEIEKKIPEMNKIMESLGWGTLGTFGAGVLAPVIGITVISGVTVFAVTSGLTYTIKKLKEWGVIKVGNIY